jgi:5-methylcytosine-specific restriction enzyme subunit McrC
MTHYTAHEWGRVTVGEHGVFSRAEANALLGAARRHEFGGADGTDILCDHNTYLRARQMVGVIAGPHCSLEILPKIDPAAPNEDARTVRSRLVHMLDVALGLNISAGEATSMAHRADSLLEAFVSLFADRFLAEVRRGLPRQYFEHAEDLPALRGRLDVVRQFTRNAVRPDRLACQFDALHADTPLMRVMKACVLLLTRFARTAETQRKLTELRLLLSEVGDVPLNRLPWSAIIIDRTNRRWKGLLELARLLLGARWQQTHADDRQPSGITLLFPMNELFERYVAVQLRRALVGTDLEVVAQGGFECCLGDYSPDVVCRGRLFRTKPDIIIRDSNRVLAVIDTKWKRLASEPFDAKHGVAQSDVYQLMAYARLYRCDRLMLLYPSASGELGEIKRSNGIARGNERLDFATVDVSAVDNAVVSQLRNLLNLGAGSSRLQ